MSIWQFCLSPERVNHKPGGPCTSSFRIWQILVRRKSTFSVQYESRLPIMTTLSWVNWQCISQKSANTQYLPLPTLPILVVQRDTSYTEEKLIRNTHRGQPCVIQILRLVVTSGSGRKEGPVHEISSKLLTTFQTDSHPPPSTHNRHSSQCSRACAPFFKTEPSKWEITSTLKTAAKENSQVGKVPGNGYPTLMSERLCPVPEKLLNLKSLLDWIPSRMRIRG